MSVKKELQQLKEKVDKLLEQNLQFKQDIQDLSGKALIKAQECDEMKKFLKNVQFRVDKIKPAIRDNATYGLTVEYKIEPIELYFSENNELIPNDRFVSINMLNLVSYEDMRILTKSINAAKNQNKKMSGN